MRNRSFLPLMEMLCMIGVFAIAAVICLKSFAVANGMSEKRSELDTAVLLAQDTCEMLKHAHGDEALLAELTGAVYTNDAFVIYYGTDGLPAGRDDAKYFVTVSEMKSADGLGEAKVTVSTSERTVHELITAWQEY